MDEEHYEDDGKDIGYGILAIVVCIIVSLSLISLAVIWWW